MAPSRPFLSIDLPPTIGFRACDAQLPKTPEPQGDQQSATEPPPPPQQKFAVKRRRRQIALERTAALERAALERSAMLTEPDTVIPTIEMSEAVSESSSPTFQPSYTESNGLLSPFPTCQRLMTPKTPCIQTDTFSELDSPAHEWSMINDSRDKQRPDYGRSGSVCSSLSDSSYSSDASSGFSAPNESCTSPESVATDPFLEDEMLKPEGLVLSPSEKHESSLPDAKRQKKHRRVRWTLEMDQHLESTYIRYLSDPRVTPFKTLPGTAPPLGVCHRVAVKARHTFGPRKIATPGLLDTILEGGRSQREGSPDTIRPARTISKDSKQQSQWPRSDGATRKRLRQLVKGKPSLSAHYQRLLHTRSPSPFTSTTASRSSEPPASPFSGHEMKISLITSTAPSMQPEGPLARLASDDVPTQESPARAQSQGSSRPADWFARIGRSKAHQKSLSLQSSLSIDTNTASSALLASPFDEAPSDRSHLLHSMITTRSLGRSEFSKRNDKAPPTLDSPFEMKRPPTFPQSLKRRFKSDEEKPRRPGLDDVFAPPSEDVRKIRNRGSTVGANCGTLFEPLPDAPPMPALPLADHVMTEASPIPDVPDLGPIGSRSAPRRLAEPVPRLGSPFVGTSSTSRLYNTFPRNYIPTASNPQPFQERLHELATTANGPLKWCSHREPLFDSDRNFQ